jgi:hypothetical protein
MVSSGLASQGSIGDSFGLPIKSGLIVYIFSIDRYVFSAEIKDTRVSKCTN